MPAQSYFTSSREKHHQMNDIKYDTFKDFEKNWRLVTVRYREDSKEMRFTYANEVAWKSMFSMKPDYPDGAMFAKTAIMTEQDPAFTSSRMPSSSVRYQFMLKDKKKYKETDGWGYALFDSEGHLFEGGVKQATLACAACHRIVPERDYVFSRAFKKDFFKNLGSFPELKNGSSVIKFSSREEKEFEGAREFLVGRSAKIESLEGDLQKNAFSGTLDEVIPLLLERSKSFARNAILYVDKSSFTLILRKEKSDTCDSSTDQNSYRAVVYFNSKKVRDAEFCR